MPASSVPPQPTSAAIVLVRGGEAGLETFWVLRGEAVGYMPGLRAFVGGVVDPADRDLALDGPSPGPDRTLRACALREAFEEAGVVLGVADPGDPSRLADDRRRLLAGEVTFAQLAREHGWRLDAEALTPVARWVTPAFVPKRFETAYFLATMPAGQQATVLPGELASGEWVKPVAAIARWRAGAETFAAPILYSLLALAAGGALAAGLAAAPATAGQPTRRIELKWGIVLQPQRTRPLPPATHTNAYLVGERGMALIDPGSGEAGELDALFAQIESLGADGRRLEIVLLTHHHPDHVAGAVAVRERYGVPVAAHAETGRHVGIDRALAEGDRVALAAGDRDWTLRVLHTPGHTRGHLCFLHERTRSLFTGDHIPGSGTVIIDPPAGDMGDYLVSLARLLDEPVETLFPAHGSPRGAARPRIRALIAHRRGREARVLAALGREPRRPAELVPLAYADTPEALWPYAERSLLAHLLKLERDGRAVCEGGRWRAAPA